MSIVTVNLLDARRGGQLPRSMNHGTALVAAWHVFDVRLPEGPTSSRTSG